jgi:hypothetical protein
MVLVTLFYYGVITEWKNCTDGLPTTFLIYKK